ncbi:sugar phosphate isomerase/epimerase family protein [Frigoriglobus tundricola]|uniref:Putative isomerase n=1 Tax=Frigoriglobus tundricola TaxID=2774151 RepID=A0A6M5YXA9_9BACT|nr:sugar phosphate isomerase/epimerase family protein [Frigoriglobus tundricola]QJW97843.1 putative isomerase [Frigoriglobus tundricola]
MFLGYNTNGFAHHRLVDAIEILFRLGYEGVAITPDVNHLDPDSRDFENQIATLVRNLSDGDFRCVIETGARYILDAEQKHQPTLISPDDPGRRVRSSFLARCVEIANQLKADCVSFWSGTATDKAAPSELMTRLVEECKRLADCAATHNVRLAFEPEPGMFIDTMDKFAELHARVNHPAFGLTIDVGHLVCNRELPVSKFLTEWKHVLWNVHIEDMRAGVHDHLMFGAGEVDFADVFEGLRRANYTGGVYVELSRHSYDAVNTARNAKAFLDQFLTRG